MAWLTNDFDNGFPSFYSLTSTYFMKSADLLRQNTCSRAEVCYRSKALRDYGPFFRDSSLGSLGRVKQWCCCTGFSWVFAAELSCSESACCCLACLVSSRKDSHDQKRERESERSPPWRCAWCHRAAVLPLRSLSCLSSASTPHPPTAARIKCMLYWIWSPFDGTALWWLMSPWL